jgi:hypothetical protein
MKKIITLLIGIIFSITILKAQAPPQAFSYKATITKTLPGGNVVAVVNKTIGLMINIRQGTDDGTIVYSEIFTPKTNPSGQIDIVIGRNPDLDSPVFSSIPWSDGIFFLQVWVDINGGTAYGTTPMSTTQLLSIPYALYAGKTDWSGIENKPAFATVASSGSYNDLSDKPAQLTETEVEGYIANDVAYGYVPRNNGTKLVTGTIMDVSGNVGIGVSFPYHKLDVGGDIKATQTIFANNVSTQDLDANYVKTNLIKSGDVTANNFFYNTVQPRYLTIAGSTGKLVYAFTNPPPVGIFNQSLCTLSEPNELIFSIDLPSGAIIKGMSFYLSTGAGTTFCDLYRSNGISTSLVDEVKDEINGEHWTAEKALNHPVTSIYSYIVRIGNFTAGDTYIKLIRIRYEINNL